MIQYHLIWLGIIFPDSASSHATQHHLIRLNIISSDSASSYPTIQHHFIWLSIILPYDPASFYTTQHHLTLRPSIILHDSAASYPTTQHHFTWLSSILQVSKWINSCSITRETASLFQVTNWWNLVRPKTEITVNQNTAKKNHTLLIISMARPCHKIWSKDVARAEVFTIITIKNKSRKKSRKKSKKSTTSSWFDCFKNSPLSLSRICKWEIHMWKDRLEPPQLRCRPA